MNFRRDAHFSLLARDPGRATPFMSFQPRQKAEPIKRKSKRSRFSVKLVVFYALVLIILFSIRPYVEQYGVQLLDLFK